MVKAKLWLWVTFLVLIGCGTVIAGSESEKSPEEYQAEIKKVQAEMEGLQAQIKRLNKEKEDLLNKYNKCTELRLQDSDELRDLNKKIDQNNKEKAEIEQKAKNELDSIKRELQIAQDKIKDLQAKLSEKIDTLKTKEAEIDRLNQEIEKKESQTQTQQTRLQGEIDELKTEIEKKEKRITSLQDQLKAIENQLKETNNLLDGCKATQKEVADLKENLTKEKDALKKLQEEITQKKVDIEAKYNQLISRLNQLSGDKIPEEIRKEEGKKHYDYLQRLNSLKLTEMEDSIILEMAEYVADYPDLDRGDECQYLIGQLKEEQKKNDEAAASYAKLICLYPDSPLVAKAKGQIKYLNEKKRIDKEFYQKISGLSSQGAKREERLFNYLNQLSNIEKKEVYSYLNQELNKFLRDYPNSSMTLAAYQMTAKNLLRMREYSLSIAAYLKITYLYPLYPDQSQIAQAYFDIGKTFELMNRYKEAVSFYQEGVSKFPSDAQSPTYLFESANILAKKLKEHDKAVKVYESVTNSYPQSKEAIQSLFKSGEILENLKRYQQTIDVLERLVKEYPQSHLAPSALIIIGGCYEKISNYKEAVSTYQRLYQEYPQAREIPEKLYTAGQLCEEEIKDISKAIEMYRIIVDKFPDAGEAKRAASRIKNLTEE